MLCVILQCIYKHAFIITHDKLSGQMPLFNRLKSVYVMLLLHGYIGVKHAHIGTLSFLFEINRINERTITLRCYINNYMACLHINI